MASPTLRQAVYAQYTASPILTGLGYKEDTIFPNYSPDSVEANRFLVIRWGVTARGYGKVNSVSIQCWAYNREPDYGPISSALLEIRRLLPLLEAVRMSPTEAVLGVLYGGDSD